MSLLSFLGSVVKKVASVATHGVSDQVLSALKSRGDAKKAAEARTYSLQQIALGEKAAQGLGLKRTETVLDAATEPVAQPRTKADVYGRRGYSYSAARHALTQQTSDPTLPKTARTPSRRARRPAAARSAPTAARTTKPARRKAPGRKAPSGGLDLAKIGQLYRAAGGSQGSGMRWSDFIKAHSDVRKA